MELMLNVALTNICYNNNFCETLEPEVIENVEYYYSNILNIDINFIPKDNLISTRSTIIKVDEEFFINLDNQYNKNNIDLTLAHGEPAIIYNSLIGGKGFAAEKYKSAIVSPLDSFSFYDNYYEYKTVLVLHETLHLLGLPHTEEASNIMNPTLNLYSFYLTKEQIELARENAQNLAEER